MPLQDIFNLQKTCCEEELLIGCSMDSFEGCELVHKRGAKVGGILENRWHMAVEMRSCNSYSGCYPSDDMPGHRICDFLEDAIIASRLQIHRTSSFVRYSSGIQLQCEKIFPQRRERCNPKEASTRIWREAICYHQNEQRIDHKKTGTVSSSSTLRGYVGRGDDE